MKQQAVAAFAESTETRVANEARIAELARQLGDSQLEIEMLRGRVDQLQRQMHHEVTQPAQLHTCAPVSKWWHYLSLYPLFP